MDGAHDILKRHDTKGRILKAVNAGNTNGGGFGVFGSRSARNEINANKAGILHPVSIHLVPASQSKSLTLVAVTGGGLRYYLSCLSSSSINSSLAMGGYNNNSNMSGRVGSNMNPRLAKTRPATKMTFCHMRAPPPYASPSGNDGLRFELAPSAVNFFSGRGSGLLPGICNGRGRNAGGSAAAAGDVVKGCYGNGVFVLALNVDKGKPNGANSSASRNDFFRTPEEGRKSTSVMGDAIVVALPDRAARVPSQPTNTGMSMGRANAMQNNAVQNNVAPGGLSEAILLPMSGLGGTASPVLPGGRTFDIVTTKNSGSSVARLFVHSETPSDVELQLGLMPSFAPRRKRVQQRLLGGGADDRSMNRALVVDRGRGVISAALSTLSFYLRRLT